MDKLKLVKTIVALLTFLLIFGTLLLLTAVYKKTRTPRVGKETVISLHQPQGSSVESFKTDGNRLFLLIKDGGAADRVLIYDLDNRFLETTLKLN